MIEISMISLKHQGKKGLNSRREPVWLIQQVKSMGVWMRKEELIASQRITVSGIETTVMQRFTSNFNQKR